MLRMNYRVLGSGDSAPVALYANPRKQFPAQWKVLTIDVSHLKFRSNLCQFQ
jgi:hypothetical protein